MDNKQTVSLENGRYNLEEYKKLFNLLAGVNDQIAKDDKKIDFNVFAIEHKRQLINVQQSQKNIDNIFLKANFIDEEISKFMDERNKLILRIQEQEDILKRSVVLELDNTKLELTKLQKSKNVLLKYQMPLEQEARFVDKIK